MTIKQTIIHLNSTQKIRRVIRLSINVDKVACAVLCMPETRTITTETKCYNMRITNSAATFPMFSKLVKYYSVNFLTFLNRTDGDGYTTLCAFQLFNFNKQEETEATIWRTHCTHCTLFSRRNCTQTQRQTVPKSQAATTKRQQDMSLFR